LRTNSVHRVIRERRGPRRSAALSVIGRTVSGEAGLSRGPVLAAGGFIILLLAVVVLVVVTGVLPGLSKGTSSAGGTTEVTIRPPSSPGAYSSVTTPTSSLSPIQDAKQAISAIYAHGINDPVRIVIPAIKVDAQMVHVGLKEDGAMDLPPYGLAAWYKLGPAPGARGPAVIIGHVDSQKKADVFHDLKNLKPGDVILVFDSNGDSAQFETDSSEMVLKDQLPTDRIWADTYQPVLRLITCGGKWDASIGHYLSNLIVYAHLVK
jgi:sortase (surface protein transpeptidase)